MKVQKEEEIEIYFPYIKADDTFVSTGINL